MTKYNTNLASEFYALSCLHRLGMTANLTLGNKKGVDIVVAHDAGDVSTVEVKGLAGKYEWPIDNLGTPRNPDSHFVVLLSFEAASTTRRCRHPTYGSSRSGRWSGSSDATRLGPTSHGRSFSPRARSSRMPGASSPNAGVAEGSKAEREDRRGLGRLGRRHRLGEVGQLRLVPDGVGGCLRDRDRHWCSRCGRGL